MNKQKKIGLKKRAELLEETISDFKEIGGFSKIVITKYQEQLKEVLNQIKEDKKIAKKEELKIKN